MGQVIISGSGGGGVTSDDATAIAKYVVKGKTYMGADTDDEIGTGTLELTGSVTNAHVLDGDTYYSTDPNNKQTGTMANIAAIDPMKSITMASGTAYVRMSNGAHITNASSGYPEVSIDGSNFGDAIDAYVYNGKTYTSSAGIKRTGKMTVSSVLSFSAAAYSTTQLLCTWKNPAQAPGRPFSGVIIRYQTGSYPSSPTSGTLGYMGGGGNSTAQGTGSAIISGLTAGTTYYLRCWAYCICSAGNYTVNNTKVLVSTAYKEATGTPTAHGRKAFTASGTWTVPAGVRSINVHCTGGGGSGHYDDDKTCAGGGGGGGYTSYQKNIAVEPGDVVTFIVGAGGTVHNPTSEQGQTGGDTTVSIDNTAKTSITANGGRTVASGNVIPLGGGKGGSGGGRGADVDGIEQYWGAATAGASDGGSSSGSGQGTTTREFGDKSGTLYSGGGGGGGAEKYSSGSEQYFVFKGAAGGGGGGGAGGNMYAVGSNGSAGTGGGGGGFGLRAPTSAGGNGGSGNVIITW